MKKSVLLVMSFSIEVEEDYLEKDLPEYIKVENSLINLFEEKMTVDDSKFGSSKWESSYVIELDEKTINCGRCAVCGAWVTDREKENHIPQLCNGATVNGQLLCDEHLPKGHKWAF